MNTFYIMVGPPGSGKTKIADDMREGIDDFDDVKYIETDDIRQVLCGNASEQSRNHHVFIIVEYLLKKYLHCKHLILDATSLTKKDRKNHIALAKSFGCQIVAIVPTAVHCKDLCKLRNSNRKRKVPEDVIDRHFEKFEMPTLEEGFDEIRMIENATDTIFSD